MNVKSLFQLGGIALVLSAILAGIGQLMYFLSGEPSALGLWIGFATNVLQVLGLGALYARLARQGGVLALAGYVLLVVSLLFFVGNITVGLEMNAGVITNEQLAQVPGFALADTISTWTWVVGLVIFGVSIFQSQVFPKYTGALVIVMGILAGLTLVLGFIPYLYAASVVVVWAVLGWALLFQERVASPQPVPAT